MSEEPARHIGSPEGDPYENGEGLPMEGYQPPDPADWAAPGPDEIRVGISACLLGDAVRYDGGHKRDRFLTGTVAEFVTFVPVCPEVDIGMSIPREPIRLNRQGDTIKLEGPQSGTDYTHSMLRYAEERVAQLEAFGLSGYILKKDSPSCGMERVRVYDENGVPARTGRGLFAEVLLASRPLLPVEEEGRLHDPRLRENFFERVFAYRRLSILLSNGWDVGDLVAFHSREKMLLLAHDPEAYGRLGRMVAEARKSDRMKVAEDYRRHFMAALSRLASRGRHRNVLEHMAGFFKEVLEKDERREMEQVVADFYNGLVPLIVPLTLVKHHVRRHEVSYLADQTYLQPHPKELMLRNHV